MYTVHGIHTKYFDDRITLFNAQKFDTTIKLRNKLKKEKKKRKLIRHMILYQLHTMMYCMCMHINIHTQQMCRLFLLRSSRANVGYYRQFSNGCGCGYAILARQ